jgi:hypothetical protein
MAKPSVTAVDFNESDLLTRSVLRVGEGRGFVVKCRGYPLGHEKRIVITAAHCLDGARLLSGVEGLRPCHPMRGVGEETYPNLIGPLGATSTVCAACLFVNPIADVAVLGQPDNQDLPEEAEAYDRLMEDATTLAVADAPAQGFELLTFGRHKVKRPTPGEGPARVLSLDGRWLDGQVLRRTGWLEFKPHELIKSGMSGSPIIAAGAAIGIVSLGRLNPALVDNLSARLVRDINKVAPNRSRRTK